MPVLTATVFNDQTHKPIAWVCSACENCFRTGPCRCDSHQEIDRANRQRFRGPLQGTPSRITNYRLRYFSRGRRQRVVHPIESKLRTVFASDVQLRFAYSTYSRTLELLGTLDGAYSRMKLRLFGMLLLALSVTAFGQNLPLQSSSCRDWQESRCRCCRRFQPRWTARFGRGQSERQHGIGHLEYDGRFLRVEGYYPVGAPVAIVSGDFNGDGSLDLAVVNSQDNTISTLLGSATGLFSPQQTFPTGAMPVSIVAVDLNSDKRLDLATANQTDGTVSVLLPSPHKQLSLPHLGWQDLCRPTLPATPCRTWLSRPSTGTSCC